MEPDATLGRTPFFRGVRFKIAAGVSMLVIALMVVDVFWSTNLLQRQAEDEAHEKATVLAHEMRAAWDYVDWSWNNSKLSESDDYRAVTQVCVVAAKSISRLFMSRTDYTIRFVNDNPRQIVDTPDTFEAEALDAFRNDLSLNSYWRIETNAAGEKIFRYAEPLYVTESCLNCHGEPVGELDQFGFKKEGMHLGEVGGAMSITEPMSIYSAGLTDSAFRHIAMIAIMLVLLSLGIFLIVSSIVLKPVRELSEAAHRVASGDFERIEPQDKPRSDDEIAHLKSDFDDMAARLEELYNDLESKVAQRTEESRVLNEVLLQQKSDLYRAYNQLRSETNYKSEFFSIMSHELRTPLTSIMAFAHMLEDHEDLSERELESVREIENSTRLLLDIVNNYLIIARAESNRNTIIYEAVDFVDLVGFVKNQLSPLAAEKDITLTARADADVPVAMADWEKLRRILENLTNNAIKYTHQGGSVDIRVRFGKAPLPAPDDSGVLHDSDAIIMTVTDDGIGIAPEEHEVIFDYYHQAAHQSPNRRYRGSGLGLAVVKELTELHGGTVNLESELKKGSTFTVAIPYIEVDTGEYDEDSNR